MLSFAYNFRSLIARRGTTLATGLGIAVVVFLSMSVRMFTTGIATAMGSSGDPSVALVLTAGTTTESASRFATRLTTLILERDEVLRDTNGRAVAREDLLTSIRLERATGDAESDVLFRGMNEGAWHFSDDFRLTSGRLPNPGANWFGPTLTKLQVTWVLCYRYPSDNCTRFPWSIL